LPRLYAIADLHLPGGFNKTMDLFGDKWVDHVAKIEENWRRKIKDDDLVLIAGDISWAMKLNEAKEDLVKISSWPGTKIMIRGNHDYWWQGIGKVRKILPEGLLALQNDSYRFQNWFICGTRGWKTPGSYDFKPEDERIYLRELERLKLSLQSRPPLEKDLKTIVMLHYPPFTEQGGASGFVDLMQDYRVSACVYGHLHGRLTFRPVQGLVEKISYHFVACDHLNFSPLLIDNSKGG